MPCNGGGTSTAILAMRFVYAGKEMNAKVPNGLTSEAIDSVAKGSDVCGGIADVLDLQVNAQCLAKHNDDS
jgi:hypothetical protein